MTDEPQVLRAEVHLDDRGALTCCNEFDLQVAGSRRVYFVRNWTQGFVRAWHGHLTSHTWLWPVEGVWRVATARALPENRMDGSAVMAVIGKQRILHIPPGWYHGHQNLTRRGSLAVFSSATLGEVRTDDLRQPWDVIPHIWEERPK